MPIRFPQSSPLSPARRQFLRQAGAGTVALPFVGHALPALAQSEVGQGGGLPPAQKPGVATGQAVGVAARGQPMPSLRKELDLPEDRKIGFAVVGLGKFALNQILPSFADSRHAKLVALVSGNRDKARKVAQAYGVDENAIYDYQSYEQMADNPAIDVVYVILPNALHAEYTVRAFEAGKHVLCEKPMATTVEDCERMIQAGNTAGKRLMIAYRAQYEPYSMEAIRLCRSGELGALRVISSEHGRPVNPDDPADQWRVQKELAGGGALMDIGIYSVQAMRYLSGEEPVEIRAAMSTPKDDPRFREIEDITTWQFRMPSGLMTIGSTSYSYSSANRVHVQGTEASLRMQPATDYYKHRMWIDRGDRTTQIKLDEINQFAAEIDHMAQAVRDGFEPKTPGEEGLRDVRIMRAIYEAADSGRPVHLDWPRMAQD